VEDICRAFLAVLHAPRELVHNQAFNVGSTQENYQIRDIATMVEEIVQGSHVKYAEGGGPDLRCYRVNCDKIAQVLPEFRPQWTVRRGIEQLYAAYKEQSLTVEEFTGTRYTRIKHLRSLLGAAMLDPTLRWTSCKRI
jgi:nucleoside-diphosphate-sugar epimerase